MSTTASDSPFNISETDRDRALVAKNHQYEMTYRKSNGHVTGDWWRHVTLKGAVRQYGWLSQRQLGFLFFCKSVQLFNLQLSSRSVLLAVVTIACFHPAAVHLEKCSINNQTNATSWGVRSFLCHLSGPRYMTLIGLGYLGLLRLEIPVSSHVIPLAIGSFRTTLVGSGWTVNKLTTLPYQTAHTGCPPYLLISWSTAN